MSARVTGKDEEWIYKGQGQVLFRLAPEPHIPWEVIANVGTEPDESRSPMPMSLIVPELSELHFAEASAAESTPGTMQTAHPTGRFTGGLERTIIGDPEHLSELRYHLIGFPLRLGTHNIIYQDGKCGRGRIALTAHDWKIDIDLWPDWSAMAEDGITRGRFPVELVRMCRIRNKDGNLFSGSDREVESLRYALTLFLSFVSGGLVGTALPVGVSEKGEIQYVEWGSTLVDPIAEFKSWYPITVPECIAPLFEQFIAKLEERPWSDLLFTLVRSYTTAIRQEKDFGFGFATAFMAHEALAWTILVTEEDWLSPDGYGKLTAADKLRLLLKWADLPADVPASLGDLRKLASNRNMDAPEVLGWIRNRIVHPDKKGELNRDPVYDAWRLSLWYLELLLLRVLSYGGPYQSRVYDSQATDDYPLVPWVANGA